MLYPHLLGRDGIRISVVREQIAADLASDEDMELLALARWKAVLATEELARDQAGLPAILGWHHATTASHLDVNAVR